MTSTALSPSSDLRYKFANVNVLLADSDARSAQLVQQLLLAFGFRTIRTVFEGPEALTQLRQGRTDLIISEWTIGSLSGVALVQAIRAAKQDRFIDEATPVIMLTGHSEKSYVQQARDAGVTEFLAKPFSARTLSDRLVEVINHPREFVETPTFKGPSRRRREEMPEGVEERRQPRAANKRPVPEGVTIRKPSTALRDLLEGTDVLDILTPDIITAAQGELMKSESEFVRWVEDDLARLEAAYTRLAAGGAPDARAELIRTAYTIKSHAGTFGYEMGSIVADMLVKYASEQVSSSESTLLVIRKHIDTLSVIIAERVKDAKSQLGQALIDSLTQLIAKFSRS